MTVITVWAHRGPWDGLEMSGNVLALHRMYFNGWVGKQTVQEGHHLQQANRSSIQHDPRPSRQDRRHSSRQSKRHGKRQSRTARQAAEQTARQTARQTEEAAGPAWNRTHSMCGQNNIHCNLTTAAVRQILRQSDGPATRRRSARHRCADLLA